MSNIISLYYTSGYTQVSENPNFLNQKQQQDLDTVKDDLGSLKFGFAILQDSVSSKSYKQKEQLKEIKKTLESRTNELDISIERLRSENHPCKGMGWKKWLI